MDTIKPTDRPNPNGKIEQTLFIPAFLEDNPIGRERDPQYEKRLMARDDTTARALRFGEWGVFAGQKFKQFAKQVHVIQPFEIPLTWTRWLSVDWGFAAPWSVHWFAQNPQNKRIFVYQEIYKVGVTDPEQAEQIKEMCLPGEKFIFRFADPSMWITRTTDLIPRSTADVYLDHGLYLTKATNDHQQKISKMNSALSIAYDGLPYMQIFDTCPALIRTIPALMSDPKNPEEILDGQEDHAFDDCTYGLTNWTPPVFIKPEDDRRKIRQTRSPLADLGF